MGAKVLRGSLSISAPAVFSLSSSFCSSGATRRHRSHIRPRKTKQPLPAGYAGDGMPIGVQVVGRRWHDMELLDMAEMIDAVAGDYKTPPGY